jgi:hypothetical protein
MLCTICCFLMPKSYSQKRAQSVGDI